MRKLHTIQHQTKFRETGHGHTHNKQHVDANTIASTYGVSGRYILKLAAEGRIPCLRIGRKCVRFDPAAVAAALENL